MKLVLDPLGTGGGFNIECCPHCKELNVETNVKGYFREYCNIDGYLKVTCSKCGVSFRRQCLDGIKSNGWVIAVDKDMQSGFGETLEEAQKELDELIEWTKKTCQKHNITYEEHLEKLKENYSRYTKAQIKRLAYVDHSDFDTKGLL